MDPLNYGLGYSGARFVGEESKCSRFRKAVAKFFYETPARIIALAVAGVALLILMPAFSPTFLAVAATMLLTRVIVKIVSHCNIDCIDRLKWKAMQLEDRFPKIRILTFIASLVICIVSPILGGILGGILGIYSGILIEVDHTKRLQELNKNEPESTQLAEFAKL